MAASYLTLVGTALILSVLVYDYILYPIFFSPLSKIPNAHITAPISPLWIVWKRFRGWNNRTIHDAHQRLGPIVRLGPSEISINCVEGGIKTVYGGGFEKHEWYPRVFGALGTVSMFSMVRNKEHSARKRMLSNIYSKSFLQSSVNMKVISRTILYDRLFPIVEDAAQAGKAVNIHELNQAAAMDFMSAYLFGLQNATNFLQDEPTRKYLLHNYQCRKPFEFYFQEVPWLVTLSKKIGFPVVPKWHEEANKVMDDWNWELCEKAERCLNSTDPRVEPTVYKQLHRAMEKQLSSQGVDLEKNPDARKQQKVDIACEMYDQVTAGHETSAIALTYIFWRMSKHPELQAELRKELQEASATVPYPPESEAAELPHPKKIDELPLLQGIVMETLRIDTPIPGIQPRVTPFPSCSLAGYDNIPPNVRVSAQAYSLHRNADVYPEPETWQPRRWLKDYHSPEMEAMRRWFWAFGSGGRMCIGSNFALQEIKLITAAIYSNYTTSIVDDTGIEPIDAYTTRPHKDPILRFERVSRT